MGLAENNGINPKPAAMGYARTVEWLNGTDFLGCAQSAGGWACSLTRAGKKEYIVWNQSTLRFSLPATWNVLHVVTIDGTVSSLPIDGTLKIGPQPVLLR